MLVLEVACYSSNELRVTSRYRTDTTVTQRYNYDEYQPGTTSRIPRPAPDVRLLALLVRGRARRARRSPTRTENARVCELR